MKKTFFVTSDVHSYYDILMRELKKTGYDYNNDSHIFVSLGDLLDRGNKPKECLEFVNSLPPERKILIRGNHEDLMEQAIRAKYFTHTDFYNGTAQTAQLVTGISLGTAPDHAVLFAMSDNKLYNDYINSCVDYAIVGNHVFVHGWIPCFDEVGISYDPNWEIGDWDSARWLNGMAAWAKGVKIPDKTIYCGHWHTSYGHQNIHGESEERFDPFLDEGIVALDACCAYSGTLNVYKIEVEE